MTNTQSLGTIEATNPVLAVAPLKEETEMLRATDKITALYCRLSVEDLKEDKKEMCIRDSAWGLLNRRGLHGYGSRHDYRQNLV